MVFGAEAEPEREPWASLRYQLLTAVAGTALRARRDGASRAVLIIHEFHGSKTAAPLVERNAADLGALLGLMNGGKEVALASGRLAGPWGVQAEPGPDGAVQLLVGKAITTLGSR
ncbi:MAG TPA: hypothetical protein VNQ32_15725 [Steroidobacteraceae bacterium]|nr:hypothetical protein [Steroidobacteraceae bacterium]